MNKHVQIRNMAASQHRKLKVRASSQGMTITDYVSDLIDKDLSRPTITELVDRVRNRTQVDIGNSAVEMVREDRDNR